MADYLPPSEDDRQGDIYEHVPTLTVRVVPLRAARLYKRTADRELYGIHSDGGTAPQGGFKWEGTAAEGEEVLAHGLFAMGITLSHDCEIENDDGHRLVAVVRPITDLQPQHRRSILEFRHYAAFPLPEQQEWSPSLALSFIDFRRITSMTPSVLKSSQKIATLSDQVRMAMAQHFRAYLFRAPELFQIPSPESPA